MGPRFAMALIDGITSGLSLAVLGDGTIVHTERVGKRVWQAIHSDAGGAPLASIRSAVIISDVSAHPTDLAEALISIPARGVHMLDGQVFAAVEGVVALTPAQGAAALVTWGRAARWLAVDPATHAVTDVAPAITGADDAIAHPAGGALLILTGAAATRRLAILKPGQRPRTLAAVPGAFRLAPTGDGQVAIGYDDGRIEVRSPATLGQATLLTTLAAPIWGLALAPGGLLAGFGSSIDLVTVTEPPGVDLTLAAEQYLGSWARVCVAVRGGVVFDELAFVVDPPLGGLVSASRDASFDPAHPNVIVAIGGTLGEYKLLALDSVTGDVLGGTSFSVVDTWKHRDGPPLALVGPTINGAPDAAWGGGDPYVPQNMNVRPRLGAYRVGVVVVETADQATLTNAAATTLAQNLRDEVFTGVARGGVTESTRLFFEAVSSGSLNLVDAGVVVPVRLPNNWDSYVAPNVTTGRTAGDGLSNFSTAAVAELVQRNRDRVAAGQPPLIDLDTVDSLVFVLRSIPASGTNPGRHQWPYGSRPGGYQQSYIVGEDTFPFFGFEFAIPRVRTIQVLTMPTTWATEGGGRTLAETIGHELCHNFGLHDAYFDAAKHGAEFQAREMDRGILWGTREAPRNSRQPNACNLGGCRQATCGPSQWGFRATSMRRSPSTQPGASCHCQPGAVRQSNCASRMGGTTISSIAAVTPPRLVIRPPPRTSWWLARTMSPGTPRPRTGARSRCSVTMPILMAARSASAMTMRNQIRAIRRTRMTSGWRCWRPRTSLPACACATPMRSPIPPSGRGGRARTGRARTWWLRTSVASRTPRCGTSRGKVMTIG